MKHYKIETGDTILVILIAGMIIFAIYCFATGTINYINQTVNQIEIYRSNFCGAQGYYQNCSIYAVDNSTNCNFGEYYCMNGTKISYYSEYKKVIK